MAYLLDAGILSAARRLVNHFSRTLALSRIMTMMLGAGVPLSTALQQGVNGCRNLVLRKAFLDADESLLGGKSLIEGLKQHPVLPGVIPAVHHHW